MSSTTSQKCKRVRKGAKMSSTTSQKCKRVRKGAGGIIEENGKPVLVVWPADGAIVVHTFQLYENIAFAKNHAHPEILIVMRNDGKEEICVNMGTERECIGILAMITLYYVDRMDSDYVLSDFSPEGYYMPYVNS